MASPLLVSLILAASFQAGWTLKCETCDGDTCEDVDRWIVESCLPSTAHCYQLGTKEGKVFRRGCADVPCNRLPGVDRDLMLEMTCTTCNRDMCNSNLKAYQNSGGGLTWKKSAVSIFSSFSSIFFCLSILYAV
ncbi:unnamed protein product [Caenorhabditis auriculariae]|uniref:UPAR/Ly6 domain-containing protein n=1 Tax=Caenorhabditis auriculariae TaxID=2777116 RepID=A0A8S1HQE4_9PELO|nr:unnamed protein product [Caenorhabditis auriculariae]